MQGAIPERKIPLKENNKPAKRVDIGGQAVLEGVMMRSPEYIALAVRRPDGSVVCKRDPYVSPAKKHKWMGLALCARRGQHGDDAGHRHEDAGGKQQDGRR